MADSDVPEAIQASDEIAGLVSPTVSDYWRTLHGYTPEAMAAAVMANAGGGGGGSPVALVGPATVNYNSANFNNPADNGFPTISLPAGVLAQVFTIKTAEFTGSATGDELALVAATSAGGTGQPIVGYELQEPTLNIPSVVLSGQRPFMSGSAVDAGEAFKWIQTVTDCTIYAAMYPAGTITAGQVKVYAITVTL